MRHHPSCWNKVLAKLGFRRVLQPRQRAAFRGRMSRIEELESRQMMTAATVNTLADVVDATDAYKSLREAIADSAVNSISFDPSLNGGRIVLTQGELSINRHMTISGPGADKLAIDAAGAGRAMSFWGASNISVSGLTITGGNSIGGGGGIYNAANLTLNAVDVSGNVTDTVGGGVALQSGSKLAVYSSLIHDNRAGLGGGGIGGQINAADAVWVVGSTISNNVSPNGAGLSVISTHATPATASVLISRSTITQNIASNDVGGIGGGVYNVNGATITSHGSIIAGNSAFVADNSDIYGAFNSGSTHNVIGRPGNSGLTSTLGNRAGTNAVPLDPKLSPLDNHGGPTKTHVPLPGSPALDAGGPESIYTPLTDQRGFKRLAERPETNVYSPEDIGAVELSSTVGPLGDFNGDGRDDQLLFDPTTHAVQIAAGAATTGNYDVEAWGVMPSEVSAASTFVVGDFNGDGREDVLISTAGVYRLAISDGSTFLVQSAALPASWNVIYASDFDGDGSDEILGGVGSGSNYAWSVVDYRDAFGLATPIATPSLNGFAPAFQQFFQDVNRDGRKDVITRASGSAPWMVRLAGAATDGSLTFTAAADWSAWIGYGYDSLAGKLEADKAMAKVIEEFAWVYNNVELELYAGFMKGLQATAETKAANPWEQAALVVQRLEIAGFEADIASGNVQVPLNDLYAWIGIENATPEAKVVVFQIIQTAFDGNAVAVDAANNVLSNDVIIIGAFAHSIRFRHAWVRVKAPTASGLQSIDIDPSWKFEDRQAGEIVNLSLPSGAYVPPMFDIGGRVERKTYDELAYLAGAGGNQLPIEWYEDQLAAYLASTGKNKAVSEIAYSGPIKQQLFTKFADAKGASQYSIDSPNIYPNLAAVVDNPVWKDALTHRMTVSMATGNTPQSSTQVPLAPGYALPDYLGYAVTDATTVSLNGGVASYGQDVDYQQILFNNQIQPYLPSDGRLTDTLGTRTSISNPAGLGLFGNSDFQYFRTSGPSDYASPGFPAQDADGTYRFVMQRASAAQFALDPNYQFTSNTRIEFDVRQIYADSSHEFTYDPILAVGYGVYDASGNIIGQPSFALMDGRLPGESGTNSSVTPQASTDPAIWRRFSIDVATPVAGQHRIFIIHADNEIINYRKQNGPFDTTALAASGSTLVRRVRLREEGTGEVTLNLGLPSSGGQDLYLKASLLGNSFKSQSITPHTITSNTWLEFKFSSTQLGAAHYIGVDVDNDYDGSGIEAVRPFAGTFAGLNISSASRKYFNGDLNNERTISIAIGAEYPHLIGQQISKLIVGAMDDGHLATSNFSAVQFIEQKAYTSTVNNGDLVLNGESYQSVDMSYMIGPDTIIEFDYESTQRHTSHSIGWDTDDNPATPAGASNQRVLIAIYGNDNAITSPYYDGSGREKIRIRVGDYFTGTTRLQMNNLIFGQTGGNGRYGNVRLYESRSEMLTVGPTDFLRLSGDVFQRLPVEYNITPRTYLEFDFKVLAAGGFAGIGWDTNSTFDNSYSNEALYRLFSSYDDPYSTAINLALNVGAVGQKTTVRIPIGAQLSGLANRFMQNLVFVNDGAKVEYSNFKLGENAPPDSSLFQQEFVIANPQAGYSTDSIQIGYDDMGGSSSGRSYVPFLEVNGSRKHTSHLFYPLFTGETAKIKTEHWYPTLLATTAQLPNLNVVEEYEREAGQVHAIVVDANQFSRDYLAAQQTLLNLKQGPMLQNRLNSTAPSRTEAVDVIGDLLSYTGAKYWYDFNAYNASIDGYMHTIGVQPRVGSGLISSDSTLITNQSVTHLNFPNVPNRMGVDLPNAAHISFDGTGSTFGLSLETLQLIGQNSSALENAVIEEVINDSSVSTMRGLSRAYDGEPGLTAAGVEVTDAVQVFESILVNGVRTIYFRGEIGVNADPTRLYSPTRNDVRNWNQLLNATSGELRNHVRPGQAATNSSSQAYAMADILANYVRDAADNFVIGNRVGTIRLLVPRVRTQMGSWSGTVYVAESQTAGGWQGTYKIAPDVGPASNGAYGLGQLRPENTSLYKGAFRNNTYAGDPVNVSNGSMFRDETDIVFANLGMPLNFSRHYNTQSKEDFGMGVGWMYSFGDLLYKETPTSNDLTWLDSGGVRHLFKWDAGTSRFLLPNDLEGVLKFVNVGVESDTGAVSGWAELRFKSTDGMEYHFSGINNSPEAGKTVVGRLSKVLDRNGDGATIAYADTARKIQTVSDVNDPSRKLTFVYNANGISTITRSTTANDPASPVPTWTYSIAPATSTLPRRLLSVSTPATAATTWGANPTAVELIGGLITSYAYYEENLPWRGLIKKITERDGAWHEYEYYSNGRTFRVKQGQFGQAADHSDVAVQTFNYNLFRNLTEFADERRNVETYIHQDNGLVERQIHADRSQVRYEWGVRPNNVLITETEFLMTSSTDERGSREQFQYYVPGDSGYRVRGQLKKSTGKDGLVTDFTYWNSYAANYSHLSDLFTTVTVNPDGPDPTTTLTREASGRGRLVASTDADNNVTDFTYYANGLLRSQNRPQVIDIDGNLKRYETIFHYDAAGNVIKSEVKINTDANPLPATTYTYDAQGNVIRSIDPANVVIESIYDVLGRLRETGFADFNAAVDPLDAFTSRFKYDAMGRVRESRDPLGRITRFEYDRQGKLLKQINPDQTQIKHFYDALGNCIAIIDALDRTTRLRYDSRNRLIQTTHPDGAVERLRYDGAGNLIASTDALGNVTTFRYDAAGRLIETKLPDPNSPTGTANPTTTNKYDKLGNIVETIDAEANVTQFKYDKLGRVVQTQTLDAANGIRTNPALTTVTTLVSLTTTDYDAVGNVFETAAYDVSQYIDAAATATLLANPRDHQTPADVTAKKVHVASMRYDAFGRLLKAINADDTVTRTTYDAAGRVRFQYDELNRVTEFRYDAFGRLDKTLLPDATTGAITAASPTTAYRYDAVGNRIATIDPRGFTTRFEYDAFNRLTATVDAQGNRTRTVYDVAGQMVAAVDALGRAAYTLYDKRGRAIEQRQADPDGAAPGVAPVTRHRYDDADRVVETIDALGYSTTYQYDNLDRVLNEVFTTGYQVIDSTDLAAFQLIQGMDATQSSPSDYGGSSKIITPTSVNAVARWNFTGVEPGDYRILVHWSGVTTTASGFTYSISDWYNGAPTDFFPADVQFQWGRSQLTGSSGAQRFENGVWNDWHKLPIGFQVSSNSPKLSVHLAAAGKLQADAVRIERIASRSYTYDANGNLLTETDPRGSQTSYIYDELDRVVTETLPDPDGPDPGTLLSPQTTTTYDGYGNVKRVTERRGTGNHSRSTDYVYDLRNRRTDEIFDVNTGGAATYLNRTTTYAYDDVGNLTTKIELPGHATLERRTSYAYDYLNRLWIQADNNIGSIVTPDVRERMALYSYDAAGNVTSVAVNHIIDPRQIVTNYRYDALGQLVEQTDQGLVGGVTEKRTTRFQYDAIGQQIATIDSLLRVSRSEFDRLGRLVKSTDPDPDGTGLLQPHVTTLVYDAAGQLIVKNNGDNATPGANEIDRYAYDPQGRLIRSEDGRGDVTTRRYDDAGNLVKLVDPAGNATTYVYDKLDRIIEETTSNGPRRFYFDNNENLLYSVDRNGRAIRSSYYRDDQVSATWEYLDLAQAQVPAPVSQQYIAFTNKYYDALGRLEEERYASRPQFAQSPPEYRATDSYKYDGLDRVIEHSNQSLRDPVGSNSITTGNIPIPAMKQTYAYVYDSTGQTVTREQFIAGQFAASTKSTYNAFDELVRQEDKEINAGNVASSILDFESTDAAFAYLADGSLASTTRYTDWDATLNGHRNRVETTYAYDGAGRLKNIAHNQSRRTTVTWPGNTPLVGFAYGYDAASRINSIVTDWNTGLVAFSSRTDETQTFTFDADGQLKIVDSNLTNGDANYNYDANGNRNAATEPGGGTDAYVTGANNRITASNDAGTGVDYAYVYDNEGNITERRLTSGNVLNQRFSWDHRNRLTKVENFDAAGVLTETVAYRYNAADDLVYRSADPVDTLPPIIEDYLVENGQRTMTLEQDGDVLHRYQYGPTGEALFDQSFESYGAPASQLEIDLRLPLGDHQNSTRVVMGHSFLGDHIVYVRQSIDYDSFGRVREVVRQNAQGPLPLPMNDLDTAFAHHGSIFDSSAELYLKSERWYSPDLGRFVSEDPIQDGANWYAFAGNDPVNYADPSGLSQQGHPFNGGFGGPALSPSLNNFIKGAVNQALNPARFPSTTFGGFVDADRGRQILSGGFGPAPASVGSIASYQALAGPAVSRQPTRLASATSNRTLLQTLESPTASFFGSLWGDAKNLGATLWEGSVALATDADARAAFGQAWQTERVQPLGDRLYNVSKGYGHSDKEIGDQNSFALFRATVGEILPINVTAQAIEGRDIGTGQRTSELQRSQDSINAASGWILFGAGAYNTGQQVRSSFNAKPNTGFVLGETSELRYPLGTAEEQIAAFRVQQRINRGQLLEAPNVKPSGQIHHPISKPVYRALEEHPNLTGQYQPRDSRFTTQAIDNAAHRGYQTWHRELDAEVSQWIRNNPQTTPQNFEGWLRSRYSQPDLQQRFPNGF